MVRVGVECLVVVLGLDLWMLGSKRLGIRC